MKVGDRVQVIASEWPQHGEQGEVIEKVKWVGLPLTLRLDSGKTWHCGYSDVKKLSPAKSCRLTYIREDECEKR